MKIILSPFPTLTTDRLVLRPLNLSDKHALMRIRSDEQVNKYLDRTCAVTLDDAVAFIKKIHQIMKDEDGVYWVISLKESARLIGTICYWNLVPEKDMAEIGYELLPQYHRQGIMQEAIAKVIAYGFDNMELKVITALSHTANENSIKLLKRNGFSLDTLHQYVSQEEAEAHEVYVLKR
jgi:ribosomal-protein-alanine N-acetyltransferase